MSNTINYVVTYDSDISSYTIPTTTSLLMMVNSVPVAIPITNIQFQRNIAPSEDNATITLAGIQRIQSAREVYIYRINSDGTYTLKFRGMTTNPEYDVSDAELVTTVQVNSLWYMLATRLFQIAGKSPPPLQPNTNPYLVYLNPTLGLNFGQLWADILTFAFQESYSTGHLPVLHLANLQDDGMVNQTIPYLTDFDYVVVNDNMNLQYQSVSATVDRLVTSALFNANESSPFLTEYRMDIGDFPYAIPPRPAGSLVDTFTPKIPTATVMLFDPVHSKLGNGQNRTGINLGDNSLDPEWVTGECGVTPSGLTPDELTFPMSYIEFGVYNGYCPVDTIIFSEGDNFVSIKLTYDYLVMNNSYVLTGGSFQGSDVVALPIDNQRSIAEFGLKQTQQSLQNVVDQGEIKRFVGTSINFFQHPIPNIVIKPDYVYFSQHTMYAGDYILVNAPSLAGAMEDSNGQLLEGSYGPAFDPVTHKPIIVTAAFTARIKTIDTTWNPTDGEDITLTLSFPVQNVPIDSFYWNPSGNNQLLGSPGGAMQFMYTTVQPAAKTMLGRGRQAEGAATYQSGEDFISSRNNPFNETVSDSGTAPNIHPSVAHFDVPMYSQFVQNNANVIVNDSPSLPSTIEKVKGDDILIYQFGIEVDTPNTAPSNTTSAPSAVYLTVLQPDGMAIIDTIVSLNQMTNILSLISKSHKCPVFGTTTASTSPTMLHDTFLSLVPDSLIGLSLVYTDGPAKGQSQTIVSNTSTTITTAAFSPVPDASGDTYQVNSASAPFLTDMEGNANLSGRYEVLIRNASAAGWCPDPIFMTIPKSPIATPAVSGTNLALAYIVVPTSDVPVNSSTPGNVPIGLTKWVTIVTNTAPDTDAVTVTWDAVAGAGGYNVYRNDLPPFYPPPDPPDYMSAYWFVGSSTSLSYVDTTGLGGGDNAHNPFPPLLTTLPTPATGPNFATTTNYEYAVTAVDIGGNESVCSSGGTWNALGQNTFQPPVANTTVNGNSGPGYPPLSRIYVVSTGSFYVNTGIVIDSGGPRQEYNVITDIQPTYLTLQNNLTYTHLAVDADTVASMITSIQIEWPPVPNAVSYNVYRDDSPSGTAIPTQFYLTNTTDTIFVDDGTYAPSGSQNPPYYYALTPSIHTYTVYTNYAFLQDPKHTQILTSGGSNSPASSIVYDPTQRRVYQTHGYVPP